LLTPRKMDDEDEMRMLRQSKMYTYQKGDWDNAESNRKDIAMEEADQEDEDLEEHQFSSVHNNPVVGTEYPLMQTAIPPPLHSTNYKEEKTEITKQKCSRKDKKKKREEKSEFKKAGESESSDNEDDSHIFEQRIPDTELIKMQQYVNHNQGSVFLDDEENEKEKDNILDELATMKKKQKLKAKLLNRDDSLNDENEGIVPEKVVPEDFGTTKKEINKKEKIKLFSNVKRKKMEVKNPKLIQRHDIDVEEEDDDLIGPPIPKEILLAQEQEEEEKKESDNVK
jgi:hypothetical protein